MGQICLRKYQGVGCTESCPGCRARSSPSSHPHALPGASSENTSFAGQRLNSQHLCRIEGPHGGKASGGSPVRGQRDSQLLEPTGNQRAPRPQEKGPSWGWRRWAYLRQVCTPGGPVFDALYTALGRYKEAPAPWTSWQAPFSPTEPPKGADRMVRACATSGHSIRGLSLLALSPCLLPALGIPWMSTRKS